jgi:dTMP kinase
MKGLFITMEGPDGSGKSTQILKLKGYFEEKGYDVLVTREPGGTRIGEEIRKIILDKNNSEMDNVTEALLYAASRAQHVAEVIKPAIDMGKIVICDRFVDSSIVYQGIGRKLGIELIEQINKAAVKNYMPDMTFLFKLSPEVGIKRKIDQGDQDRLECERIDFHERVFRGYIMLKERYPHRIRSIDASKSIQDIHREIIKYISEILN